MFRYKAVISVELKDSKEILNIIQTFRTNYKLDNNEEVEEICIKAIAAECDNRKIDYNNVKAYSIACAMVV